MKTSAKQVISKFESGLFAQVLELFEESASLKNDKELLPFWIGALVLTGDQEKAQARFKKTQLPLEQTIACRFYLALGFIRLSKYDDGKALLVENLLSKDKIKTNVSLFFIYHGLAFYRFFCGRFSQSKKYAELAYKVAVAEEFTFGEMISKDLLAHSLMHVGQVRKGLKFFEDTLKTAKRVKNEWLMAAIEISLLKFRAQFGVDPKTDLINMEKALKELRPQDTYSIAELNLEIFRQQIIRGRFDEAEAVIALASETIYKHQNRRQMALLNLRMAYMLYLQAQHTQALHILRFAEQNIDRQVDLTLWTQISGLKAQVLRASGKNKEAELLQSELLEDKQKSQSAINHKILLRSTKDLPKNVYNSGEDSLGDLLDLIHRQDASAPKTIIENKYYGLLHKYYKLPFGAEALIFDLMPGSLVILDKGNVTFMQKGINSLIRKILLLIRQEPHSKEQLIQSIWGYEYDPLRHDPLIYSTINKIRKMLGPYADWIVLTETGYVIDRGVKVIFKNALKTKIVKPTLSSKPIQAQARKKKWDENFKNLNYRQLQIVDYLKENNSLSISELSEKLEISKPTATRDLSQLYNVGILKRAGKGRATRYFIQ